MENQKKELSQIKSRKSLRNDASKFSTPRNSHIIKKSMHKIYDEKVPQTFGSIQNPMRYLQSIQKTNKQMQDNLQESFIDKKWRYCNSSTQAPKNDQLREKSMFHSTLNSPKKKELTAIKIYNHVHNKENNKNFEQPQMVEFIQEAVHRTTRKNKDLNTFTSRKVTNIKKANDQQERNPDYAISQNRKELQKLQFWIKNKIQTYKPQNQVVGSGQNLIIEKINILNMAFGQISRIAGTHSTEIKNILDYLHKQYYEYYNFLIESMMEHNRKLKSQNQLLEQRLHKTIIHYEERLEKIISEHQQKSQKVIQNFHKCIEIKKKLERQNKQFKAYYNHQKKKVKLMQEGLIKVITLFLALGQKSIEQMTFNQCASCSDSNYGQKKDRNMNKSSKTIMSAGEQQFQRKKFMFQQWCGYLIKMIHKIVTKDVFDKATRNLAIQLLQNQAFDIIQKYLVDNDTSLSLADADNILKKFMNSEQQSKKIKDDLKYVSGNERKYMEQQLQHVQMINQKFEKMFTDISYQLPSLQQVFNKLSTHSISVQADIRFQSKNYSIQTFIQTCQAQIMVTPKTRSRQIDTKAFLQQKLDLASQIYGFTQVFRKEIKQKQDKTKAMSKDEIKLKFMIKQGQSQRPMPFSSNLSQHQNTFIQTSSQISKQSLHTRVQMIDIGVNTQMSKLKNKTRIVEFNLQSNNQKGKQDKVQEIKNSMTQHSNLTDIALPSEYNLTNQEGNFTHQSQHSSQGQDNDIFHKSGHKKRKNGFLINNSLKKEHLSLKFISNNSETSIVSKMYIDQQQEDDESSKKADTVKKLHSQSKSRTSLDKSDFNLISLSQTTKSKNFEQRLALNRSFANLQNVEYATKQQADSVRNRDHLIKVPKKKTMREKFLIDCHDFHLQLVMKNHEKIKFLSSITLWHPKIIVDMKKIRHVTKSIKPFPEMNNRTMNLMKGYFNNIINPILTEFLKSFYQQQNYEYVSNTQGEGNSTKSYRSLKVVSNKSCQPSKSPSAGKSSLTYYHRLSPLFYSVLNKISYHENKTSSENQMYLAGLKTLRNQGAKMEIYNLLMEGSSVQLDIFIKSLYYFNLPLNNSLTADPELSYYILETTLIEILQGYLNNLEIEKIILEVKKMISNPEKYQKGARRGSVLNQKKEQTKSAFSKLGSKNEIIGFYQLLKIIFRSIRERKQVQKQKYEIVGEILSKSYECTYYQNLMYLLDCLPIQGQKKKKILYQSLKHSVYWQKSQTMIPNDVLYFIFDHNQLTGNGQKSSVIKDYVLNRCELYFKNTLKKISAKPEVVLKSSYITSYKIPRIFHNLIYQLKTSKSHKQKQTIQCLLTQIYCNIIDSQFDKRYMPTLFNGLSSIPSK